VQLTPLSTHWAPRKKKWYNLFRTPYIIFVVVPSWWSGKMKSDVRLEKTLTNKQHNTCILNYTTVPNTYHTFLPVPSCEVFGKHSPVPRCTTTYKLPTWRLILSYTTNLTNQYGLATLQVTAKRPTVFLLTSWLDKLINSVLALRDWHGLAAFERRAHRRWCELNRQEVRGKWRQMHNLELHNRYPSDAMRFVRDGLSAHGRNMEAC
jgi:hypothetical protein